MYNCLKLFNKAFFEKIKLKSVLRLVSVVFLVSILVSGLVVVGNRQNLRSKAQQAVALNVECNQITVTPVKRAYQPGEEITINVTAIGNVSDIKIYWVSSTGKVTTLRFADWELATLSGWSEISGTYDPVAKIWTGKWRVPQNGEYLIAPDIIQADGYICSGNPGYICSGCEKGTVKGNGVQIGTASCSGCYKSIAVSSADLAAGGYNFKEYFNYQPGNFWLYKGTKYNPAPQADFLTLDQAEEMVNICSHILQPRRLTKDKKEGYIMPNRDADMRQFLTYFQPGEAWSETALGKLIDKHYFLPNSGRILGNLGRENFGQDMANISTKRHFSQDRNIDSNYYAPHPLIMNGAGEGWNYEGYSNFYADYNTSIPWSACSFPYNPLIAGKRYITKKLFTDYVSTPAYTGPVLRLRLTEAGFPVGYHWMLREDWYLAKGIGRVQIDTKNLDNKCYYLASPLPNPDPDCYGDEKMQSPDARLVLVGYYIGGSLSVIASTSGTTTTLKVTSQGGGQKYTGRLEVKGCKLAGAGRGRECVEITPGILVDGNGSVVWVQEGVATVDLTGSTQLSPGTWKLYVRPMVEKSPSDAIDEVVLTNTQLPWSNMVTLSVQGTGPTVTATPTSSPRSTCATLLSLCRRYGGMFCQMAKSAGCR